MEVVLKEEVQEQAASEASAGMSKLENYSTGRGSFTGLTHFFVFSIWGWGLHLEEGGETIEKTKFTEINGEKKGGIKLPRGNIMYGPGFWKQGRNFPDRGGYGGNRLNFAPEWGRGLGYCRQWLALNNPETYSITAREETEFLKKHANTLRAELDEVQKEIDELEKKTDSK